MTPQVGLALRDECFSDAQGLFLRRGKFFLDAHVVVFGKGGCFVGAQVIIGDRRNASWTPEGCFCDGVGGDLWLPRSLCETGGMGRFWDGILGYFCNVFSWAKLPASKLVGLESWFKNKFALSSCILNLSVFTNVSHSAAVGGSVVGVVGLL